MVYAVVATKCDILETQQEITRETLAAFALHHQMSFYQVSAKTGEGIDQMLKSIANDIVEQRSSVEMNSRMSDAAWSAEMDEGHPLRVKHVHFASSRGYGTEDTRILLTRDLKNPTIVDKCCSCCSVM